jgi:hypothetical protein
MSHLNLRCDEVPLGAQLRSYIEQRLDQAIAKLRDKDSKLGVLIHRVMDRLEASIERRTQRHHEKRKGGKRSLPSQPKDPR